MDAGVAMIYSYDLNGNLISVASQATPSQPLRSYTWDAADRLIEINRYLPGNIIEKTNFAYNGLGKRIRKTESLNGVQQSQVAYLYGSTGVLQERSADGSTVRKTYAAKGEMDYTTTPSATQRYYTRDHLGSIREILSSSGTTLARYDYSAYGIRSRTAGTYEAEKGYTGHDYDAASDLILTRYRAYEPSTGLWLSSDPIEEAGGLNLYGYAGNDPVNKIDVLGDFPESLPILIGGGAPAIVGGTGIIIEAIDAALAAIAAPWSTADEGLILMNEERLRGRLMGKRCPSKLPALDGTGKVHGVIPSPKDLRRYPKEDLRGLRDDLIESVQERIRKNSELGFDKPHGQRQGAEQDLIKSIDNLIGTMIKFH